MNLPERVEGYDDKSYWDSRYEGEPEYEWFTEYRAFRHLVHEHIPKHSRILMLGCGNSKLSADMYRDGYHDITNMDYSAVVIDNQRERCAAMAGMTWEVGDIHDMAYSPHSYDVVMEKGTLDVFLVGEKDPWTVSEEASEMMDKIISQVSKILKKGGKFISVTFSQPHFRKPLLARDKYDWSITTETFGEMFHFFFYVMKNGESLSVEDKRLLDTRHKTDTSVTYQEESDDEDFLLKML